MRSFYEEGPIAYDANRSRLTVEQIHQINIYLDRAASGRYSRAFFQDLYDGGYRRFQEALRKGDKDTIERLGPEVASIAHVIKVAFKGNTPTKTGPDPKHMEYVEHMEREARKALPKKDYGHPNKWVIPHWHEDLGDPGPRFEMLRVLARAVMEAHPNVYDIAFNPYEEGYMEVIFEIDSRLHSNVVVVDREETLHYGIFLAGGAEFYYDSIEEALVQFNLIPGVDVVPQEVPEVEAGEFAWLEPELRADILPLSDDPVIAALQQVLRKEIIELYEAEQEEQPDFIINKIRRRMAAAHEKLIEARSSRRYY